MLNIAKSGRSVILFAIIAESERRCMLILDDLIEPLKNAITKDDLINPAYEKNCCVCGGVVNGVKEEKENKNDRY